MGDKIDCRKYTTRIFTSDYVDGNGVLVGNYLITSSHILDGSESFEVWIEDKHFKIETNSYVFFQTPLPNECGDFLDLSIYKISDVHSPVEFFDGELNDVDLRCLSWKHTVDSKTNQEHWTPFETDGVFLNKKGNFIECMMYDPLVQGFSGCPIFTDGKLVGILYGSGDGGRTCFFLSGRIIRSKVSKLDLL